MTGTPVLAAIRRNQSRGGALVSDRPRREIDACTAAGVAVEVMPEVAAAQRRMVRAGLPPASRNYSRDP